MQFRSNICCVIITTQTYYCINTPNIKLQQYFTLYQKVDKNSKANPVQRRTAYIASRFIASSQRTLKHIMYKNNTVQSVSRIFAQSQRVDFDSSTHIVQRGNLLHCKSYFCPVLESRFRLLNTYTSCTKTKPFTL